ncbi:MAG: phenylacetate--CoA ligase family protein, partial [Acidobacteria bacterium]|nr:phenylacetate--CoA ligase family protein [Acidobacteriota bacterium]
MSSAHEVTFQAQNEADSIAYEELRRRHVQTMLERVPLHLERLAWPAERLHAERESRLREMVRFARDRSPWHGRRLAHVDPDSLGEDNLNQLPVMTKDDLMENFDEVVTDRRINLDLVETHLAGLTSDAYLLGRYHAIASGGSCGRRGVFVWDWEAWADLYLGLYRFALRGRASSPELKGRPIVHVGVGADHPTHATSSLYRTFTNPALTNHLFPVTLPMDQIVSGLNRVQPEYLSGYSSALHALAFEARAGRLHIEPQAVFSGAEPLLPEIRTLLETTWRVPVINIWASSEGATAVGCGYGPHMHLNDDLLIVEPVDAAGRPEPPGVRSAKLYLTNLYNRLLPLIRYEITDEITLLDERCPCGSAHRLVADVQGR